MKHTQKRAFTLVELMVAILILLIGVTSVLSILPLAFNIQQNSKDVIMSEILARNASAMLSARKIKYKDLNQAMLSADFNVFQPMQPLDYAGYNGSQVGGAWPDSVRSDGLEIQAGNALLYADTGRMAFPLPNGRVADYAELASSKQANLLENTKTALANALASHAGQKMRSARKSVAEEFVLAIGLTVDDPIYTELVSALNRGYSTPSGSFNEHDYITTGASQKPAADGLDYVNNNETADAMFSSIDFARSLPEVRYTRGGKHDFDERRPGYAQTDSVVGVAKNSKHLWGYNFSENMMGTYEGTGTPPAYLWTIKDRSFPSLSNDPVAKRDYYWVPLLYDADPRPGRFEWRAYVVVTVRFPGRNYKYQGEVYNDNSLQAFAANPRDPDSVPRVTSVPMDLEDSSIQGDFVERYNGASYSPLIYTYYNSSDMTSTKSVQASVGRGEMSKQDAWQITGPNDPIGQLVGDPEDRQIHHGYVSGRFIPGDKFKITVGRPYITSWSSYDSNGWVLAGATPTSLYRAGQFEKTTYADGLRHPVPFQDIHYNPRNSSFQLWCWMSHTNGIGRPSVGRVIPVSGQVVDMAE